jgi:16S rRNA processing protein RimM
VGRNDPRPGPGEELLAVGRITRAHGIRGEVAVLNLTEVETRFQAGSVLRLEDGRVLTVESARPHGHRLLVKFEQVPDRTVAEALRGQVLLVPAADAPAPAAGSYWVHQVVGLEVVTDTGRSLGRVREVLHNPANDLWVTDGPQGEMLIPALGDVVLEVDLDADRAVVREIEGLTVARDEGA